MDRLNVWLETWKGYLTTRWQEHVVPTLIVFGVTMVVVMVAMFGFFMIMGGFSVVMAIAAAPTEGDPSGGELAPAVGLASVAGVWGMMGLMVVAIAAIVNPLVASYDRATLRSLRGTPIQPADMLWGYKHLFSVLAVSFGGGFAIFVATLFCFVPGMILQIPMQFREMAYSEREEDGVIAALSWSWELTKPQLLGVFVWNLLVGVVALVAALVPVVGNLLMVPIMVSARAVVFDDLVKQAQVRG